MNTAGREKPALRSKGIAVFVLMFHKRNLRPVVRMDRDKCRVTWYEILTHQGIYRRTYEIMRSRPYETKIAGDVEILKIRTQFIY